MFDKSISLMRQERLCQRQDLREKALKCSEEEPGAGPVGQQARLHENKAIRMQVRLRRRVHYQHKEDADDCLLHREVCVEDHSRTAARTQGATSLLHLTPLKRRYSHLLSYFHTTTKSLARVLMFFLYYSHQGSPAFYTM